MALHLANIKWITGLTAHKHLDSLANAHLSLGLTSVILIWHINKLRYEVLGFVLRIVCVSWVLYYWKSTTFLLILKSTAFQYQPTPCNDKQGKSCFFHKVPTTFQTLDTGKSLSEALIFASTNPQYDGRLFIELQVQYMKTLSSEHGKNLEHIV